MEVDKDLGDSLCAEALRGNTPGPLENLKKASMTG